MLRRFDGKPVPGRLVYSRSERSFDVEPRPERSVSSLLGNDVQIEIDEDGRLVYVWGLCPHESWKHVRLVPPAAKPGRLHYVGGSIVPGVSKRLNSDRRWPVVYDPSSRWLRIGDDAVDGEAIAFAPGAVALLREGQLIGLWLHADARS